jgi:outer membrane receptor protein involved in Fe transport
MKHRIVILIISIVFSLISFSLISFSLILTLQSELFASPPKDSHAEGHQISVKKQKSKNTHIKIQNQHFALQDALQESNIYLQQSGDLQQGFKPSIRGSNAQNQGVELQGIPIQNARSQSFDFSILPISLFESIEVENGSNTALVGSGNQSGKIALQLSDQSIAKGYRLRSTMASTRVFEQAIQYKNIDLLGGYQLSFSYTGGDNAFLYENETGFKERRTDNQIRRIAQTFEWSRQGKLGEISIFGVFSKMDKGEAPLEKQIPVHRKSQHDFLAMGLKYHLPFEKSDWQIKVYGNRYDYVFIDPQPLWQSQNTDSKFQMLDTRYGAIIEGKTPLSSNLSLLKKIQYEHLKASGSFLSQSLSQRKQSIFVLGLQHQSWLESSVFIRLDHLPQRALILVPFLQVAKALGIFYIQSRTGRAFRDPGFDELYLSAIGIVPNPNLKQEDGYWADLSLSVQSKGAFSIESQWTAFYQKYQRMIIYMPLDPYRLQAQDRFQTQMQGIEWLLKIQQKIQTQQKLSLQIQGSYIDHQFLNSPYTPLPLKPNFFSFAKLAFEDLQASYTLALQAFYRSELSADRFHLRKIPAFSRVDLMLSKKFPPHWEISASIRNLLDQPMRDMIQRPLPGIAFWLSILFLNF